MADESDRGNPRINIPSPDPSNLTREALHDAIENIRTLFLADIKVIDARIAGIDRATEVFNENLTRVPTDTDKQISHLKGLHDEKFNSFEKQLLGLMSGIAKQFLDADVRYKERFDAADLRYQQRFDSSGTALAAAAQSTQAGIAAALAAAKEAVQAASVSAEKAVAAQNESNAASISKSEMSVTKQIDSIMTLLTTSGKTLDEKIAALTARMDRGEGAGTGASASRTERRLDTGAILGLITAGLMLVSVLVAVLGYAATHSTPPATPSSPAR